MNLFTDLGLLPTLLKTLKDKKIFKPTEIQRNTIPMLLSGQSVVGVSETGSGKTLAYALPILHQLKSMELEGQTVTEAGQPRAIVIVPTRELGEQVSKVFKSLTHETRLRVRPTLGGMTAEQCRLNVSSPFEILLATPGRLVQLFEKKIINFNTVKTVVIDEADQMMDQGFLPDTKVIVNNCPEGVQLALFSATVSNSVQELMNQLFADAEVFRSSGSGKVVSSLTTKNMIVQDGKRWPLFEKILSQKVTGGTLIFTNTREQCDKLAKEMLEKGFNCAIYRGEMEKSDRRANYKKFRDGEVDFLIATDLAGRGLDLDHVGRVINYHLPKQKDNYLHRVGRTARAGRPGLVINLVTERDERLITSFEGNVLPPRKPYKKESKSHSNSPHSNSSHSNSNSNSNSKDFKQKPNSKSKPQKKLVSTYEPKSAPKRHKNRDERAKESSRSFVNKIHKPTANPYARKSLGKKKLLE